MFYQRPSVYFLVWSESSLVPMQTQCLKITEKVSFNFASEASYVYILSGQKLIKNPKKWYFLASF